MVSQPKQIRHFSTVWTGTFALLTVAAAHAQPNDYSRSSSPAEMIETRQLNDAATRGQLRPEDQVQYQQQLERYQTEQNRYQRARSRYDKQRVAYDRQRDNYLREHSPYYKTRGRDLWRLPDTAPPVPHQASLSRLYLLAEPSQQLARAPLVDGAGNWVGRVRNVETAFDGRPSRVQIVLYRDQRAVWVRPDDLDYDTVTGVLFTPLRYHDLRMLPGHDL
jgi:hypothetical protein